MGRGWIGRGPITSKGTEMEYGLYLSSPAPLPGDARTLCPEPWRDLLPVAPLTALYFGSEFCPELIPRPDEAREICRLARCSGVDAVLLTPMVTDRSLTVIRRLLETLVCDGLAPEVVCNDWGVLQLLRRLFPPLRLRGGRLMNRTLRDPRLANVERGRGTESGEGNKQAPQGESRFRRLLGELGVTAVETDPDLEGSYLGGATDNIQRVLHLPYTFAATGRNCLIKAESSRGERAFTKGLHSGCSAPCRGRFHEIEREDTSFPLWRAGNTIFYQLEPDRRLLERADRVVIHERPQA
jgi:hypothetical protein